MSAQDASVSALTWPKVKLGDVSELCLGKMLDAAKNKGEPHFYLRNPDVRWFDIDTSNLRQMPFESHELDRFGLLAGDVLICEGGEAGRAAIWSAQLPNVKFQKAIHRVRTGPGLLNRFLVHRLKYDFDSGRLADYYTGATIKHLTGRDLARYEFSLPPIPDQHRIVAVLDKADVLRAKRREAIAKLDQLLQSVFLEMFGDPVTNPKGWPETELLGDVAEICSGITKGRRTTEETRETPYLAVANVQDRHLKLDSVKTICATDAEIERYRLAVNDLLLTEGGDPDKLGRGALWDGSIAECIHQNHVFRVRVTSPAIDPVFLNWLVGSARGKRYFLSVSKQTTGIASINMTQLKKFPLLTPPIELQTQFAQAVSRIEAHQRELKKAEVTAEKLFQSLQQQAFAGQL